MLETRKAFWPEPPRFGPASSVGRTRACQSPSRSGIASRLRDSQVPFRFVWTHVPRRSPTLQGGYWQNPNANILRGSAVSPSKIFSRVDCNQFDAEGRFTAAPGCRWTWQQKSDSNGKAEVFQHLAAAEAGNGERAAVEVLAQPSSLQHQIEERRSERTCQQLHSTALVAGRRREQITKAAIKSDRGHNH